MQRPTHRGVLLPDELIDAGESEKDAYAEQAKAGNRAFIDAYHALEDAAEQRGFTMGELDDYQSSRLSIHRGEQGLFVAYGYVKADGGSPETCRVSPFYDTAAAAKQAYDEKRREYGETKR